MRRFGLVLFIMFMLFGTASAQESTYQNPMAIENHYAPIHSGADDYGIGDPFVMRYNGMYYLYASSCEERVRVYSSPNMIDWEYHGYCTENQDVDFAYAPEVIYWRGDFYMVTSPKGNGHYILKSDSPLGIFRPITHNFGYAIDGSFYVKDDGKLMLLYPNSSIIKQSELDEETLLPDNIMLSTGATLKHWTEGPGLFRRGDWYYLTLTGNHLCSSGYRVAYASRYGSPTGTFYQPLLDTLIINSVFGDDFTGLGHSSNVIGPDLDSMYTAYHSFVSVAGPARLYNVDRLFTNGGLLYTTGPTNFEMPMPSMPDVYGDVMGELGSFTPTDEGYFASITSTNTFTQECNFVLDGGVAAWVMGEKDGKRAIIKTDGKQLWLEVGEEMVLKGEVPTIGRDNRLHTLRIEHTDAIMYVYIDSMRVLTQADFSITAKNIGALSGQGVSYSFLACTAHALGSSDYEAVKVIPGTFSAIHMISGKTSGTVETQQQQAQVPLLNNATYPVLVAKDGSYCFDLTVAIADAGKDITIIMDGKELLKVAIPSIASKDEYFTFTTEPIALTKGSHVFTLVCDNVHISQIASFSWQPTIAMENDFTTNTMRQTFATLGAFNMKKDEGVLRISPNKSGFALFGDEGNTDYEMRVRFKIPKDGIGSSGIIVRGTHVSLYEAQVADSYYGYSISLSTMGINVRRIRYGAVGPVSFESVSAWKTASEGELIIRAKGGTITISLPDGEAPLATLTDTTPFTHGHYGFFSTGKELEILLCDVKPLE